MDKYQAKVNNFKNNLIIFCNWRYLNTLQAIEILRKCCSGSNGNENPAQQNLSQLSDTTVSFQINGQTYTGTAPIYRISSKLKIILSFFSFKKVRSGDVPPDMSLAHFIRDQACLKGTKISCNQGGCGACVVTASLDGKPVSVNSVSFFRVTLSINFLVVVSFNREASKVRGPFYLLFQCLAPVLNCNGWSITTIEGLGSEKNIHPVQERLAVFNGTQCGFCTPGMVMQMNR